MAQGIGIGLIVCAVLWAVFAGAVAFGKRAPLKVIEGVVVPLILAASGAFMILM